MTEITGETSDGFHTFNELYAHRMLLTAALLREWEFADGDPISPPDPEDRIDPHKSWRHSDGELAFGGGWFIVVAQLPTGQISYHYEAKHWDLFKIPERERAATYDGHTAGDVLFRLEQYLS